MTPEQIILIHKVYNEVIVTQTLDRETLFKTYKIINGIDTQNIKLCLHCITSFCMNYPLPTEEEKDNELIKIDKRTKEYKDGQKEIQND